jgi:hypothetical protein
VHQSADRFSTVGMHDKVNMITRQAITVNRHPVPADSFTQPFTIRIPITGKPQQKLPVMTPVRQMVGVAFYQIV